MPHRFKFVLEEKVSNFVSKICSEKYILHLIPSNTHRYLRYTSTMFSSIAFCSVPSVVSDSVRPHRWQPTRLPCPWDSPGKNTGVGCHFLLQWMKVKSESEVIQACPTPSDPMDCSLPGSSVHGIFQARVLEWGAIAFSTIALYEPPNFHDSLISYDPHTVLESRWNGEEMITKNKKNVSIENFHLFITVALRALVRWCEES